MQDKIFKKSEYWEKLHFWWVSFFESIDFHVESFF